MLGDVTAQLPGFVIVCDDPRNAAAQSYERFRISLRMPPSKGIFRPISVPLLISSVSNRFPPSSSPLANPEKARDPQPHMSRGLFESLQGAGRPQ